MNRRSLAVWFVLVIALVASLAAQPYNETQFKGMSGGISGLFEAAACWP